MNVQISTWTSPALTTGTRSPFGASCSVRSTPETSPNAILQGRTRENSRKTSTAGKRERWIFHHWCSLALYIFFFFPPPFLPFSALIHEQMFSAGASCSQHEPYWPLYHRRQGRWHRPPTSENLCPVNAACNFLFIFFILATLASPEAGQSWKRCRG